MAPFLYERAVRYFMVKFKEFFNVQLLIFLN